MHQNRLVRIALASVHSMATHAGSTMFVRVRFCVSLSLVCLFNTMDEKRPNSRGCPAPLFREVCLMVRSARMLVMQEDRKLCSYGFTLGRYRLLK